MSNQNSAEDAVTEHAASPEAFTWWRSSPIARTFLWIGMSALWLGALAAGVSAMLRYEFAAGTDAGAPKLWPAASAIPRKAGLPTLIVMAHPRCPCTKATIQELAEIVARKGSEAQVIVAFFTPADAQSEWTDTASWRSAAAIPGVEIFKDQSGREARMFNASTSGRTLLYDRDGQLMFDGGITGSRGHAGDNAGCDSILSLLSGQTPASKTTPTYGCSIAGCPAPQSFSQSNH